MINGRSGFTRSPRFRLGLLAFSWIWGSSAKADDLREDPRSVKSPCGVALAPTQHGDASAAILYPGTRGRSHMATLHRLFDGSQNGQAAVVFVHGLNGKARETWMSDPKDDATLWPVWIGEARQCSIWSLDYDASLSRWQGQTMPLMDQGTAVLDALVNEPDLGDSPLVLVGHSMGGLVIKTALVNAWTQDVPRNKELAQRVRGVAFVATPHNGSHLANLATALPGVRANPQVGDLRVHDAYLRNLNVQFRTVHNHLRFAVRSYSETVGVSVGGRWLRKRVMVVSRGSSEPHIESEVAIPLQKDHFEICKPALKTDQLYKSLLGFIDDTRPSRIENARGQQATNSDAERVLARISREVSALYSEAKDKTRTSRRYHHYYWTYHIGRDGWADAKVDMLLTNVGEDALSMIGMAAISEADFDASFEDVNVRARCSNPVSREESRVAAIPTKSSRREIHWVLCFVPPIKQNEKRRIVVEYRSPRYWIHYQERRSDEVELELAHEDRIEEFQVTVTVDNDLPPIRSTSVEPLIEKREEEGSERTVTYTARNIERSPYAVTITVTPDGETTAGG